MSNYYKQKALQATENKIESNLSQSGFFVRNLWKVIGFGVLMAIWAPIHTPESDLLLERTSAMESSDLSYYELVISTAVFYTIVCFLGHLIWKWQDKKALNKLLKRKEELETELGIKNPDPS